MVIRRIGVVAAVVSVGAAFGAAPVLVGQASQGHVKGSQAVCSAPAAGDAACMARVVTVDGKVQPNAAPSGFGPADLQSAYNLPSATNGAGMTVAIVDAYNDPYAVADVNVYRKQFGLGGCTTSTPSSTGCTFTNGATIRKVNQNGGTSAPRNNGGWAQEISLDLDMVSAVCPKCNILLVEASSSSLANLGTAVNRAVAMGANVVSNSYGGGDSSSDASFDAAYYNHPGHVITASTGDSGYGVEYPAASPYVTAVGGTSLSRSSGGRGWSETAWSGAGSGCSTNEPRPSWQTTSMTACSGRGLADVSAVADPNTGVAVYDSYSSGGYSGWLVFGGTSVASPVVASVYALAGNTASATAANAYTNTGALNDVTSGSNGGCGNQQCNAGTGWDGPTGLGTPNGTGAF
ncbi:MAG TPA: S53 family peptidase [Candidatus Dormibacteraeota bacterium]|nr:S53 family peptidase [Candidatus Dormibacteraeota bacterium]